jgi:hypothetical protein
MKELSLPGGSSGGHFKIFYFLPSHSYKGRTYPCFREVSLNLSLKRAFSNIYINYILIRHLQIYNGNAVFSFFFTHTHREHNFPPIPEE